MAVTWVSLSTYVIISVYVYIPPSSYITYDLALVLYVLGVPIISMMYDKVIRCVESVAIPIAYIAHSLVEKATVQRLQLLNVESIPKGYTIHLTESHAPSYLPAGLPLIFCMIVQAVLKPLLMNAFSGAEIGTSKRQSVAHCSL